MDNNLSQQQLEQTYKQQQNFFYENISAKLKFFSERQEKYEDILNNISEDKKLTVEQFELVGSLSYLVGIDYINQIYLTKQICENVAKRFGDYNFSYSFLYAFVKSLDNINEETFFEAKESFKNKVLSPVFLQNDEKLIFKQIIANTTLIIKNSILPINMAVGISEIMKKQEFVYEDIIKLNSIIQRQCKLSGISAVKPMIKLYSTELWIKILDKGLKYFDNQKFAVVYVDGILSLKEANLKFKNNLINIISNDFEDYNWEEIEDNYNQSTIKPVEEVVETEKVNVATENSYVRLPDAEISEIQSNYPFEFILNVMGDLIHHYPKTTKDFFDGIDAIFEQTDYYQNVYHYLKANISKLNIQTDCFDLNIEEINEMLGTLIETMGLEYKDLMEKSCMEIPKELLDKVYDLINDCIKNLILVTDEQKQFLISQIIENNITTYQHLQQMLTLIEKCDIVGTGLNSYYNLDKFLRENTIISEVFEISEKIEPLQMKLSFVAGFGDFCKGMNNPALVEENIVDESLVGNAAN